MTLNSADVGGRRRASARLRTLALLVSLLAIAIVTGILWQVGHSLIKAGATRERMAGTWPRSPWKNARLDVKYVGDEACATCHRDSRRATTAIRWDGRWPRSPRLPKWAATGRPARSLSIRVTPGSRSKDVTAASSTRRPGSTTRDGSWRRVGAEVHYALGSGSRGVSYLVERDGRLFQSPISWYSQQKKWDLSPGYERRNDHFDRPIEPQCLFCHANRVEPVELSVNRYEEPIFRGHAVGCERCHGPGELHARGQEIVDGKDVTIVNPRHLDIPLRAAVCEQCHILGDHRIDRPGRGPFDYRPGLPTIDFFAVYRQCEQVRETRPWVTSSR